jgi:hypothetical protein
MDKILAWHFLPDDGRLANRNRRKVEVGKTYSVRWPIAICENGMHGARRLIDALSYAPGAVVERVEIWGDVVEHNDKLCGRHRKCLALVDVTRLLHEFACDVAEDALKMAKVKDKRSWAAIEMKRKWLKGKATNDELAAAGDAAWDAAWDKYNTWLTERVEKVLEENNG